MSLSSKSIELIKVLETIASELRAYDKDDRSAMTVKAAGYLDALANELREAINKKSKTEAKDVMYEVSELMSQVSAMTTKGEMDIFSSGLLEKYWDLKTIFQEAKYRDDSL